MKYFKLPNIFSLLRRKKRLQLPLIEEHAKRETLLPPPIPAYHSGEESTTSEPKPSMIPLEASAKVLVKKRKLPRISALIKDRKIIHQAISFARKYITSNRSHSKHLTGSKSASLQEVLFSFFSKAFDSIIPTRTNRDLIIVRPSRRTDEWQLWKLPFKNNSTSKNEGEEIPTLIEEQTAPPTLSKKNHLVVAIPTGDLMIIPLWVSSEGNISELLELELSSRHLVRREMAKELKTITVETTTDRTLLIVLLPTTSLSHTTAPFLKHADRFEAAVRLLPQQDVDLLIWQELGEVCFGFIRKGHCIWCSSTGEPKLNTSAISLIKRMALRLQSELVIERMPQKLRALGEFSEEELTLMKQCLWTDFTLTHIFNPIEHILEIPSPFLPSPSLDIPPHHALLERAHQEKQQQIKKVATIAFLVYAFLLLVGAGNLMIKRGIERHLNSKITANASLLSKATRSINEWKELRSAVDPTTYALDVLASIANQIHGEKIRLITLNATHGHLQMTGEAADVAQAYRFIELIKKSPELQEYQWSNGQPKLAGKNNVRFELEGSRPDAKTSAE